MVDKVKSEGDVLEILLWAHGANKYARSVIKRGTTQLENNALDSSYVTSHNQVMKITRSLADQPTDYILEDDPRVIDYENRITTSAKYSVGNCSELATQALDYVLKNADASINAELYNIEGGDHVFLVLNRDPNSNPHKPETWGNAVICDPWSDAVYLAADYKTRLKNFLYKTEIDSNNQLVTIRAIEDLKPTHVLCPVKFRNTTYLRKNRDPDKIKINFDNQVTSLREIITKTSTNMARLLNMLVREYGVEHEYVLLIQKKLKLLHNAALAIEQITNKQERVLTSNDYRYVNRELSKAIREMTNITILAVQSKAEEKQIIAELTRHVSESKKTLSRRHS